MPKIDEDVTPTSPKGSKGKAGSGKPTTQAPPKVISRPVIYPELEVFIKAGPDAMTVAEMKEILGWESESDYAAKVKAANPDASEEALGSAIKFGSDFFLTDMNGEKVRLHNNTHNRDFRRARALAYSQDILNQDWADSRHGELITLTYEGAEPHEMGDGTVLESGTEFETTSQTLNGESIIVGRTGQCLSVQHRGIGLIFAAQIWAGAKINGGDQSARWQAKWEEEPSIECIYVRGVSEDAAVVRTLDNTLPRSLTDIIQTSPLFASFKAEKRGEASAMLAHAVRMLWNRVGQGDVKLNAFTPHQTNSAMLDFISLHPRLVDCVRHIQDENAPKKVKGQNDKGESVEVTVRGLQPFMSPGYAAALLYLQATSDSDGDIYRAGDPPSETGTNWEQWERACEFWTELAKRPHSKKLAAIVNAVRPVEDEAKEVAESGNHLGKMFVGEGDGGLFTGGNLQERLATLAAGWRIFKKGRLPKATDLQLEYDLRYTDAGTIDNAILLTQADFGGIDYIVEEEETPAAQEKDPNDFDPETAPEAGSPEWDAARLAKVKEIAKRVNGEGSTERLRAPEEVTAPPLVKFGPDGKPAPTKVRVPMSAKEIQAEQTRKAKEADEAKAKEEAAATPPAPTEKPKVKRGKAATK